MMLSDYEVKRFIDVLAANTPAPGGGAVSALAGALGSALLTMVANLTVGKKKYKAEEPLMREILNEVGDLQESLVSLIDRDTEAFNKVADVFKMPKNTKEEKMKKRTAMDEALKYATLVPFTVMEKSVAVLRLFEKSLGHTNRSAASDVGVGALCLKTALHGAWLNVKINLSGIKDNVFVEEYEKKSKDLLDEGTVLADKVYRAIVEGM